MCDAVNRLQSSFDDHFGEFRDIPIGIYGTGKNAQLIAENIKGYDFVCLITKEENITSRYGLPVVCLDEALARIQMIIIAAVPASTAIVYKRISSHVPQSIPIYDMRGVRLTGEDVYKNNSYWDVTEEMLIEEIDKYDCISFDVFDTLITRRVLTPRDLFDLLPLIPKEKRTQSEVILYSRHSDPTLEQIYAHMAEMGYIGAEDVEPLAEEELRGEIDNAVVRKTVLSAMKYARSSGKKVFLTSDMYLFGDMIRKILDNFNITDYDELLVSCDHKASKEDKKLYDVLRTKAHSNSILHIGDNLITDIENAKEMGISTFYVKNGYDMLAESSASYLFDCVHNRKDRFYLGSFVSEALNDPFSLGKSHGKMRIDDYRVIALYIFPITYNYVSYVIDKSANYDGILFASRDGYFVKRMYDLYKEIHSEIVLPEDKYVYMSRSAVGSASATNYDDIEVFSSKISDDPKLNLRELFKTQFHFLLPDEYDLTNGEAIEKWGYEGLSNRLKDFYDIILRESGGRRDGYIKYLDDSGVTHMKHPAIVDIVTQGTLVYGLGRMMKKDIGLIAMGTTSIPNRYIKDTNDVHSMYGNVSERVGDVVYSTSEFAEYHLFLEMLYGSTDGQLYEFDHDAKPVFVPGTEYNSDLLIGVQNELEPMFEKAFRDSEQKPFSDDFALAMLKLCSEKYSEYSDEIRSQFVFEDPYDGSINTSQTNLIDIIS